MEAQAIGLIMIIGFGGAALCGAIAFGLNAVEDMVKQRTKRAQVIAWRKGGRPL